MNFYDGYEVLTADPEDSTVNFSWEPSEDGDVQSNTIQAEL